MARAYALLSSLCLSPALIWSLEPAITDSNEAQVIEAPVAEQNSTEYENTPPSVQNDQDQSNWTTTESIDGDSCGCTPRPQRIEIKHIESKGIGYNTGYTTLEGFFTVPSTLENDWVPFLDLRGHVFNDGRPAANVGLGLRYLDTRVWGANLYYDYRKTSHFHYNQVGAGLESLGKMWDFRINGYFPVGEKSRSYHYKFNKFKGHRLILKNKKEFAMTGGNAEVGAHAYQCDNIDLYAAAGPYYFSGERDSAWGGEGRLALTAFDWLRLQVSGSYDKVFKGIVQGELGLVFSWGGRKAVIRRGCNDCSDSRMIIDRALQRVDRQEIIVASHKHEKSTAINPATGDPYTFWFVNNLSHSQGTFESPFNTLAAAETASGPNDVIYVFPGDGTDTGMNTGILLKHGQQLLGAGINQTISTKRGKIVIPAHATGLPLLSNTLSIDPYGVQLAAGSNVVSGFNIQDNLGIQFGMGNIRSSSILIRDGTDYLIQNNTLSTFKNGNGINIYGGGGGTTIQNNLILCRDAGVSVGSHAITLRDIFNPIKGPFSIENNTLSGINSSTGFNEGVVVSLVAASTIYLKIFSNTFTSEKQDIPDGSAIRFEADNSSVDINGNYISLPQTFTNPRAGVFISPLSSSGVVSAKLNHNISLTVPPVPGYLFTNPTGNPAALEIEFGESNTGTRVGP